MPHLTPIRRPSPPPRPLPTRADIGSLEGRTCSQGGRETERFFFGLHIVAPPSPSAATSATAACRCGYHRSAKGRTRVQQLVADYTDHRAVCPRHAGMTERRDAA